MKEFQRVLAEERLLLSVVTVRSFGGGYLLGHRSNPSFDGPLFRAALRDKNVWKRIQSYKDQLTQAEANLDETRKNLEALQTAAGTQLLRETYAQTLDAVKAEAHRNSKRSHSK